MVEVESFEEFKVGDSEVVDAVEPVRARLARKAGVGWCEDVGALRGCGCDAGNALRPATTVQDKYGAATAAFVDAQGEAISKGFYAGLWGVHGMQSFLRDMLYLYQHAYIRILT